MTAATVCGDRVILQQALNNRGLAAHLRHDHPLAIRCFDQAAELARKLGDTSGIGYRLYMLGLANQAREGRESAAVVTTPEP